MFSAVRNGHRSAQPPTGESSTMTKSFVLGVLLISLSIFGATAARAQTQTIFIAQTAAGAGTGADCGDPLVYTFFNSSANWAGSFTAGKISPGTTVEICGTITVASNTNVFHFQGPGTSSSPITLFFGPSASLQSPAFGSTSNDAYAIFDSQAWTIIDGGGTGSVWNNGTIPGTFVPNGIIEDTANGTELANQQSSQAIDMEGCSNCIVRNLEIANMYVHTSDSSGLADNNPSCAGCGGVILGGGMTGTTVTNNVFHDMVDGVYEPYNTDSNITISGNEIYNTNHAIEIGNNGSSFSATNIQIFKNKIHDYANWDTTSNAFHHDGIFTYNVVTTGPNGVNAIVYDNMFYGAFGNNATAWIFASGGTISITAFNNLFIGAPCTPRAPFDCNMQFLEGATAGAFYNNTFVGPNGPNGALWAQEASFTGVVWENNVEVGGQVLMGLRGSTDSFTTLDFNVYGAPAGPLTSAWQINQCPGGGFCSGFAQWQSSLGQDSHSTFTNTNLNLNSNGSPGTGSPALNAGANLTSLCGSLPPLCLDIFGNPRPATGPWDAGASQVSGSSESVTVAPASYNFATTMVGSSSSDSPATFTLTNNTGVTISGVIISFTGATPGDFTETTSCVTTLASSASCQIFVSFTPTATGLRIATLSVSDSDASSPQTSGVSGTAIPSSINPSPVNPITFGVVVTDPSIPSTVKNEKHSKDLSAYNF
jgi:hypothetical protein